MRREFGFPGEALFARHRFGQGDDACQQVAELHRFTREAQFAGLAAGQIQHVGDEVGEMLGAGVDAGEIAAVVFRQRRAPFLFLALHHLDGAHDQAERGAQFVAHRGEEAAFEAAGVLGLLPGAADLLAQKQAGQRRADLLAQDLGEASPAGIHRQQHEAKLAILKVQRQRHQTCGASQPATCPRAEAVSPGRGRRPDRARARRAGRRRTAGAPFAPAHPFLHRGPGSTPRPPGPAARPPGCPSVRRGVRRSGCAGSGRRAAVCPARPGSVDRLAPAPRFRPPAPAPAATDPPQTGRAVAASAGSSPPRMTDSPACQTLTSLSASASRCRRSFSVPRNAPLGFGSRSA